jgi:hypothetical protein
MLSLNLWTLIRYLGSWLLQVKELLI